MYRVHIRHLRLTGILVSPLRRVTFSRRRKSNQKGLPLAYGLRCAQVPSFRSRSVGTPPRAILGPSRLSRHPCREAHCAEPPLGLPMGRADQKPPRRPTGRPVWRRDPRPTSSLCGSRACPRCRHLVLSGGAKSCHRGQARSHKGLVLLVLFKFFAFTTRLSRQRECPSQKAERRCCYGGGAACPHNSAGGRAPASLGESAVW